MGDMKNILEWPLGKLDFSRGCLLMGILNVTEDSFSDGGLYGKEDAAVNHALDMVEKGADIIDIGAESTRPGATPIEEDEQIRRVVPIIENLKKKTSIPISIDTYSPAVAEAAIHAGASIINDITAMANPQMANLAANTGAAVVLMHMRGTPQTMQKDPHYENVVEEVLGFLLERADVAEKAGIEKNRIFIDPGIGFGKTIEHNLKLLKNLDKFSASGYRLLVGTSRKAFIGKITGKQLPAERTYGTAATVALAAAAGASIVRVHDVAEMKDVLKVTNAIRSGNA